MSAFAPGLSESVLLPGESLGAVDLHSIRVALFSPD